MKVGLDTNILVRWLVDDGESGQLDRVARAMALENLHLSSVAVAETIWVLSTIYSFSRDRIRSVMLSLSEMPNLTVEGGAAIESALAEFERHGGDFNDHLIAAHDHAAGCAHTLTFDKKAARSKRFKLL
ncbi:MAG TPA: type II toxin-antitoxin system VapC family toxin [Mesorhizobium sp.]